MAQSEHHEETEQIKVPDVLPACALVPAATRPPAAPEAWGRPAGRAPEQAAKGAAAEAVATEGARRCEGCKRKVGLMGFRCRCGGVFCGEHRYSDRHGCAFDYRAAGRDAIARANPVVRAEKVLRI